MLCYHFPIQLRMFMVSFSAGKHYNLPIGLRDFSNMPTKISLNRACVIGQIYKILLL